MRNSVQGIILLLVCGVIGAVTDEVKSVSVYEGESVTLHTNTNILTKEKILWRFGIKGSSILLVEMINYKVTYDDSIDGRLRDRLLISDTQTGDLTINNMRVKYSGLYEAEIQTGTGTSYKNFSVVVKESPLVIGAGQSDVKSVSVTEGESVTLQTDVQTQRDALILWRFGDKGVLIAKGDMEDNKISVYDGADGRFRDRLKTNDQTGDLTITNSKTEHSGLYQLKIISNKQPLYKTFSVIIRGGGVSSGAVAGLCIFFLLVIAAVTAVGVILYRREKQRVIFMTVTEGDLLTLPGDDCELQPETQIVWTFNGRVIMTDEMMKNEGITENKSVDQQFKDRLKLNPYYGYLIIEPTSKEDTGLYEVKITNNKQTLHKRFQVNVTVEIEVPEEDPLTLPCAADDSELLTGTRIVWTFNDRVIMTGEMTEDEGINVNNRNDPQFKGRLTFNDRSLFIKNISKVDAGLYEVKITNNKETLHFIFRVNVTDEYKTPFEGETVHLNGAKRVLETGTQIVWKFKGRVIMTGEMTKDKGITEIYNDDQQFKGRLELGDHVGYLIIKPILSEDIGLYEVKITNNKETLHNKIQVNVIGSDIFNLLVDDESDESPEEDNGPTGVTVMVVSKGYPLTLIGAASKLQIGTRIEWKFKGREITTGVMTVDTGIHLIKRVDQQFNGRLNWDHSVGYLIINNISEKDSGIYEVNITNKKNTSCNKTQVIVIDKAIPPPTDDESDKMIVVSKGDCLTLPADYSELLTGAQIQWKFKDREIMTGVKTKDEGITETYICDQHFKGRLKLNLYYGQLIINNISKKDIGVYEVKITNEKGSSRSRFKVKVIGGSPEEDLNEQTGVSARTRRSEPEPTAEMHLLSEVV